MPRDAGERGGAGDAPRTDLPPRKEPYYDGYFGTGEEAGAEREREAPREAQDDEPDGGGTGDGDLRP